VQAELIGNFPKRQGTHCEIAVFKEVTLSRNDRLGYWLNLSVVSWADIIWVLVVVLPGYVPLARGMIPPAFWLAGALCTTLAQRHHVGRA